MQRYAALISYRGTNFCGWQRQKGSAAQGSPSIQETIETALAKMTGEPAGIVGSGRTDAGVHASGQVFHFSLSKKEWPTEILKRGLNSLLSTHIRVQAVQTVSADFHAQRGATCKQYSYYFQQGPCALPHLEPYSWWIQKRLDIRAMSKALKALKGTHDFKPFQGAGAATSTTVRKVLETQVSWLPLEFPEVISIPSHRKDGFGLVQVRLVGTGFLKQMVRGIAGTLLQVGEGRRPPSCMQEILDSLDRKKVGPTAPGRGLWLEKVWYPDLKGWI